MGIAIIMIKINIEINQFIPQGTYCMLEYTLTSPVSKYMTLESVAARPSPDTMYIRVIKLPINIEKV